MVFFNDHALDWFPSYSRYADKLLKGENQSRPRLPKKKNETNIPYDTSSIVRASVLPVCDNDKYSEIETGNEHKVHGSSVVESLTRDRGGAGSSLTGVTALCPGARTLILA